MSETVRRRVLVTGRVQGVGYRYSCRQEAQVRGLAGWVANRPDGSVEAAFEGSAEAVESMIDWCRRGPGHARVAHVTVHEERPTGGTTFGVL